MNKDNKSGDWLWRLIDSARLGGEKAADDLISAILTMTRGIAASARHGGIVGDHRDFDDFHQEFLIKIWTNITQFKGDTVQEFSKWLCVLARNEQNDDLRKIRRERDVFEKNGLVNIDFPSSDDVFDEVRKKELRDKLNDFLEGLDAPERLKFNKHLAGKTFKEIAGEVGVSKSTVERHVKAIQKVLIKKLGGPRQ